MTHTALPNLKGAIDAALANRRMPPTKAATVAWYQLQAALAVDYAERQASSGFAPTQPFIRPPAVDMDAVRARAEQRHDQNVAWLNQVWGLR